jgi:hypothetical protein
MTFGAAEPSVEVRVFVEPPPPTASVVELRADAQSPQLLEGDVAAFVGAVREFKPETFGDLLIASLTLGARRDAL